MPGLRQYLWLLTYLLVRKYVPLVFPGLLVNSSGQSRKGSCQCWLSVMESMESILSEYIIFWCCFGRVIWLTTSPKCKLAILSHLEGEKCHNTFRFKLDWNISCGMLPFEHILSFYVISFCIWYDFYKRNFLPYS